MPDSTASRAFSKWTGPATVVEVLSPYSYVVEVASTKRHFHANKLRKFHVRVESMAYDSLCFVNTSAVVYENDNMTLVRLMSYRCPRKGATSQIVGSFGLVPRVFFGCAGNGG